MNHFTPKRNDDIIRHVPDTAVSWQAMEADRVPSGRVNRLLFDTWLGIRLVTAFEAVTGWAFEFDSTAERPRMVR